MRREASCISYRSRHVSGQKPFSLIMSNGGGKPKPIADGGLLHIPAIPNKTQGSGLMPRLQRWTPEGGSPSRNWRRLTPSACRARCTAQLCSMRAQAVAALHSWNDGRSGCGMPCAGQRWPALRATQATRPCLDSPLPNWCGLRGHEPETSRHQTRFAPKAYLRLILSGEAIEESRTHRIVVARCRAPDWSDEGLSQPACRAARCRVLSRAARLPARLRSEMAASLGMTKRR